MQREELKRDDGGAEVVEVMPSQLVQMDERRMNAMQVWAQEHPRTLSVALQQAKDAACLNPDIARDCTYVIPRDGKQITGPSARLAEIMLHSWRNVLVVSQELEGTPTAVMAMAYGIDVERNVAVSVQVRRRATKADGTPYNDDMRGVTTQAAQSIARRNVIFSLIPRPFVEDVQEAARKTARGEEKGLEARRVDAVAWWDKEHRVDKARVLNALGVAKIEDVTWDHIDLLLGWAAAIRTGEVSLESIFPPIAVMPKPGRHSTKNSGSSEPAGQPAAQKPEVGSTPTNGEPVAKKPTTLDPAPDAQNGGGDVDSGL